MSIIFALGRVLLVLIFIVSGAQKLLDISGTAALIDAQLAIPAVIAGGLAQFGALVGLTSSHLLAIIAGSVEFIGGLLVAFDIATRPVAVVLALYTVLATGAFHDFWNMTGEARMDNMIHAMKNVSIIGGLLVFVALGSLRPARAAGP